MQYAEKMYSVGPRDLVGDSDEEELGDIESSITKELGSINPAEAARRNAIITTIRTGVECLIFARTTDPVKPVEFVHRICSDAKTCLDPRDRKTRYLNRLTPITASGKANEKAVEDTARKVLAQSFELKAGSGGKLLDTEDISLQPSANPGPVAFSVSRRLFHITCHC